MEQNFICNTGKNLNIAVDGKMYKRYAVKTHLITAEDKIEDVAYNYTHGFLEHGDILFISEKSVACTEGRAIPMGCIRPRKLAVILSCFVVKTPYGIGLGIPETMEMALRECGTVKILFAAAIGAAGKLLGQKGWFYIVAGAKARGIDGPCDCTIAPYNRCVVLTPSTPDKTAEAISKKVGVPVIIVDINDFGADILGVSSPDIDAKLVCKILRDNPLGQSEQQTPIGIIRQLCN